MISGIWYLVLVQRLVSFFLLSSFFVYLSPGHDFPHIATVVFTKASLGSTYIFCNPRLNR